VDVRNNRRNSLLAGVVCLAFTASGAAWADPAHPEFIENPYQAHVTNGQTARFGTSVGKIHGDRFDATALGFTAAWGQRFNRLSLEAEFSHLGFSDTGPLAYGLGNGNRLGVVARFEFLRLGSHWMGPNSMLAFYVEGGAAQAWNHWDRPSDTDPQRIVPDDTQRVEGQGGFGLLLDHRLMEPHGFSRIGWFLGWRYAMSPHDPSTASVCRGTICRVAEPMSTTASLVDRSMLFQSSMTITW
jgi:hypothetical protein